MALIMNMLKDLSMDYAVINKFENTTLLTFLYKGAGDFSVKHILYGNNDIIREWTIHFGSEPDKAKELILEHKLISVAQKTHATLTSFME